LVLAGLYQFAPLKYACLDKCRSPLSFITEHWRGSHERTQAFRLGIRHGLFCIGCCWSLMLLMFAVGAGNIGWMLVLGAVMAIEKNLPWGRRLSKPLGVVLVLWGVAIAAGARFLAIG
jgi:predicted metal-binding membrane protein